MANQVLFNPSPKQEEFLAAILSGEFKYVLFGGAIRGGKTYAALGALIILCRKYPGSRWIVVRDSLQNLKQTTIKTFKELCPANFLSSFNQDTMTATLTNGSQIIFFGEGYEDDKELLRWRGLECNGFVLEECNELQESSFYKAIERAGTYIPSTCEKPKPLIMLTCNPAKNWVKTLFYDRYILGTLPRGYAYIPSKITDNPFICNDADYMESLSNMPTYEYEVYVNGNWDLQVKTGGEAYKAFDIEKHTGDYEYDPNAKLFLSFDENVNPYLPCGAFQVQATDKGFEARMITEVLGIHPNNTVEAVCDMILKKFPPSKHKSTVELYGDATSVKQDTKLEKGSNFFSLIMGYLKDYKITNRVPKSNEGVAMRLSWINAVLEKENGGVRFRIDKRCKQAISDFTLTKENPDGGKAKTMVTDPKTKVRYQAVAHITDLTDYFLCGLFAGPLNQYKKGGRRGFNVT